MGIGVFIVLCSVVFCTVGTNVEYTVEGIEESPNSNEPKIVFYNADEPSMVVRKCCPVDMYFSTLTGECEVLNDTSIFDHTIIELLLHSEKKNFASASEKIKLCPETLNPPKVKRIPTNSTHSLLQDGSIHDYVEGVAFSHSNYCLELIGDDIQSLTLTLIYCLESLQNTVPKCCPENNFFDTRIWNCSSYYGAEDNEGDNMLLPFIDEGATIIYESNLECNDIPMKIKLHEAVIHHSTLCVNTRSKHCYNSYEFCVENVLKEDESKLVQSAFVCPDNFINKCCPDGLSLHTKGCEATRQRSPSLVHILRNYRYQVKSLSHLSTQCTTITIEDNTKSDIQWTINSAGQAEIYNKNETIRTRNFCIDDFSIDGTVSPVIKVCSEEIFKEYHPVSTIENVSENVLSKCCPSNMVYYRNSSTDQKLHCIQKPKEITELLEEEAFFHYNISHLLTNYAQLPKCTAKGYYHKYDLGPTDHDYAEVTANWNLTLVRKDNKCIVKSTEIDRSKFCIDLVMNGNKVKAVAVVCGASNQDYHSERSAIIVTLVGISCAALISTFFSLIFMRVRRGMFTVKKMSTLAGRIQASYVLCLLVGYLVLGIGTLADFQEDAGKCFVLAGFLIFFMMAAFCWNSSICLEGLLLTLHFRVPESTRYFWHSVWAWGAPGVLTAFTLIKDYHRDDLPCDAIVPKIGVDRCFFSDPVAQLVYFYLPISATVVMNGVLLTVAKVLRRKQLRSLEKDPNRVRRHEHLKQALSVKSIKSRLRGEPSSLAMPPTAPSNHSGLRMHQNRNIWIESLKLVLWSGTTWLMEVIGTLVTMQDGRSRGEWYNYMWYLPVGFNCLRGLGIFFIISLTSENKVVWGRFARKVSSRLNDTTIVRLAASTTIRLRSTIGGHSEYLRSTMRTMTTRKRGTGDRTASKWRADHAAEKVTKTRSTSVSTIITNISSSTVGTASGDIGDHPECRQPNPKFYHSVSQLDSRTRLPEVFECYELEADMSDKQFQELRENADKTSLDNTSMENVFWDNELKGKVAQQESQRRCWFQLDTSLDNDSPFYNPTSGAGDTQNEAGICYVTNLKGSTVSAPAPNVKEAMSPHGKKWYEDFDYCTRL